VSALAGPAGAVSSLACTGDGGDGACVCAASLAENARFATSGEKRQSADRRPKALTRDPTRRMLKR
jgi:hypothetical protein